MSCLLGFGLFFSLNFIGDCMLDISLGCGMFLYLLLSFFMLYLSLSSVFSFVCHFSDMCNFSLLCCLSLLFDLGLLYRLSLLFYLRLRCCFSGMLCLNHICDNRVLFIMGRFCRNRLFDNSDLFFLNLFLTFLFSNMLCYYDFSHLFFLLLFDDWLGGGLCYLFLLRFLSFFNELLSSGFLHRGLDLFYGLFGYHLCHFFFFFLFDDWLGGGLFGLAHFFMGLDHLCHLFWGMS